jgi:ABC-type transport system involved in multi-copper enzyme maturation permease subunit
MTALFALFIRSVRDDLRSKSLLWARIGIAFAILFSIFKTRIIHQSGGAPGLAFFSSVVWMNFFVICIAGLSYFSSSVTEEKEEGTLGLLRMTDLSPFAILLGKSTSRLIGGLLLLLVQVPFAMLAITMGGIGHDQVLKCYAVLGAFLFFACNIGLLGSVIGRNTGFAAVVSGTAGAAYLLWPMALNGVLTEAFRRKGIVTSSLTQNLEKAEPIFFTPSVIGDVLSTGGGPIAIASPVLALVGGGIGAFLLARIFFERFCSEESSLVRQLPSTLNRHPSLASSIRRSRPGRPWGDAVAWRDFYYLHGGSRGLFIKVVLYGGLFSWFAVSIFDRGSASVFFGIKDFFSMVLPVALFLAAFESLFSTSRIYRLERRNKTLSSLYLLPQDIDDLIRSKRRAVLLTLAPAFFFIVPSALVLIGPFLQNLPPNSLHWVLQGAAFVVAQIFLTHYLVAFFSLKMKWGGLPLALVLWWIATMFAFSFTFTIFWEIALFILIIASTAIAFALRRAFRRQLTAAAQTE